MFTIIIPIHNKLPHLDRSIHSVLKQSFTDFELLLVDDASQDGSLERIKEYSDPRICILTRTSPGPGGYAARNLGIREAKYEWIAFLDADDEWHENYLEEIYRCINKHPEVDIVATKWVRVTSEADKVQLILNKNRNNIYTTFDLVDYLKIHEYVWTGAVVTHINIINKAGAFPVDKLCKRGGDVDTWIRWLDMSNKNILINDVLSYYYQGTVNQVTNEPNTHFCAYENLKKLYIKNSKNKQTQSAIVDFSNKFMYNMLARQIKYGKAINFKELKKFYFNFYSISRIGKLLYLRLKYLLTIKNKLV